MPPSSFLPAQTRGFHFFGLGRVSTCDGLQPLPEELFIFSRANLPGRFNEALPLSGRLLLRCLGHVDLANHSPLHSIH